MAHLIKGHVAVIVVIGLVCVYLEYLMMFKLGACTEYIGFGIFWVNIDYILTWFR